MPLRVVADRSHEGRRYPEGVEQIPGAHVFVAVVLLQVQEVLDVSVPWLDIDGDAAVSFSSTLVHVSGGHVEHAQHRYKAVARSVCAAYVRTFGPHVVNVHAYSAGELRDPCALVQCVVYPVDAVAFHGDQVARAELWTRGSGIEQGGGSVSEELLAHQGVRLLDCFEVSPMDAYANSKPHMLGSLNDFPVNPHEVSPLQGLEPEIVDEVVSRIVH